MIRRREGVTLIELIIMIAIAAAMFVGTSRAYQTLVQATTINRDYLIALNLAKRQMAIMNNSAYPAVVAETALAADPAFPDFIVTQQVASVATSGVNSIRLVTVRVRRGSISGAILIRLDTYRNSLVTFGNGV